VDKHIRRRLTEFSHGAGCACKLGSDELAGVLRTLSELAPAHHADLLVGIEGSDDAGVFRLTPDLALVQTVDFFTPIVDEAFDWGRIAAANALSDVYAMGGRPLTALQIVAWPSGDLPIELLGDVLRGGSAVLEEAGCALAGGHTVDDPEPKYGLAVTGVVHPDHVITNGGGRPGDVLVLTKPIGTGLIATAIKRGVASSAQRDAAVASMATLNAGAARAMGRVGVRGATDVTGYGLLGHLGEMLRAGRVSAELELAAVPLLPGVRELAGAGVVAGGSRRNLATVSRFTDFGDLDEVDRIVLADAQTSGGLLAAVDPPLEKAFLQALAEEGAPGAVIGRLTARQFSEGPSGRVVVR
jgi:selenide,water dikinase